MIVTSCQTSILQLRKGEIVGIAGIEGNGQSQLVDSIIGLIPAATGRVRMGGSDITDLDARGRRSAGIGLIPEDRHHQGLLLPSPLWENAALGHQYKVPYANGIWIDKKGSREQTDIIDQTFWSEDPKR